ncbi:MAG: hypothetical protein U1D97_15750, partial [Desulfuromonadales bacterium]|nr:hypothetical protein [Desulfuromonadales bacterium]
MSSRDFKKKSKTGAILLIVVFSLLQLSLWGPSFIRAFPETETHATCQGDHALCGCAPSRIAAGTCCCALAAISPCCQKAYIQSAIEEKAALGTVITSLPCGGSEDPLVTAGIKAYLLPKGRSFDVPVSTTIYQLLTVASQLDHPILPP